MKFLNWKPKYSGKLGLEKGIKKTIEFLENTQSDNNENKKVCLLKFMQTKTENVSFVKL